MRKKKKKKKRKQQQKKAGTVILISDQIEINLKKVLRDKDGHYLLIR